MPENSRISFAFGVLSRDRIKAKSKRAVVKKVVPTVETVIVDVIEEPVPGVMVVTEFEATAIR